LRPSSSAASLHQRHSRWWSCRPCTVGSQKKKRGRSMRRSGC